MSPRIRPINHFSVDSLLQCGWVWLTPSLSSDQRRELNRRAKTGHLIKERAMWPNPQGSKVRTIWRIKGFRPMAPTLHSIHPTVAIQS